MPRPEIVELPVVPRRLLIGGVVATVVLAVLGAVVAAMLVSGGGEVQRVSAAGATVEPGTNLEFDREPLDVQGVLARVQPSVVTIETGQETVRGLFEGAGSGLVISEDGLILTNAHVIQGADDIQVAFFDGTVSAAELIGSFPDDDIALIQAIDVVGTTPAALGTSENLRVGDEVVAIGNALNLGSSPSVTLGIVSAKGRSIDAGLVQLTDLVQTDAAINPGNSGGPLVDAAGEVVGINTAIIDDAQNIGFAISIDAVRPLIDRLVAGQGEITPDTAFLGVTTQAVGDLPQVTLDEAGVTVELGAFVADIVADSAAELALIEPGDVIVAIDGEPVDSPEDVARIIRSHVPGDRVDVEVVRGEDTKELEVELGSRGG